MAKEPVMRLTFELIWALFQENGEYALSEQFVALVDFPHIHAKNPGYRGCADLGPMAVCKV
jgi:hypothetical protein